MEKEIIYKRSRRDIVMYLLLLIIVDLGAVYMILSNSYILGLICAVVFGIITIYHIKLLIVPTNLLIVNKEGIKTKYTKGKFISWEEIGEIYIDNDTYKNRPVDVIAIKLRKEEDKFKNIKFPQPRKKASGDYNINLQFSDSKLEDAYKEIREFYRKYIK